MQFTTYLRSKLPLYLTVGTLLTLVSCGSYQYVGYDSDGIYGSSGGNDDVVYTEKDNTPSTQDNSYYKRYFSEKSEKYDHIVNSDQNENIIFTDVDDYEGNYDDGGEAYQGYAGWGQNNDNVTVNIYSNWGWNGWGWNSYWYNPWRYHYGWNWNWHWGWYSHYYSPYWYPSYYGYYGGYYNPYYYGYYNGYRNPRNIAYNSGRRGSYINNSRYSSGRIQDGISRNNSVRRSGTSYNPNRSDIRRYNTTRTPNDNTVRSNTSRGNQSSIGTQSNPRSNTRINSPSRSTSEPSVRSSSPSRSSSSSSSGRSSGGSSSRRGG